MPPNAHERRNIRRRKDQPLDAVNVAGAWLTLRTVVGLTGWSEATVYRRVKSKEFPPPIKLGPRCVRWPASAVSAHLENATAGAAA